MVNILIYDICVHIIQVDKNYNEYINIYTINKYFWKINLGTKYKDIWIDYNSRFDAEL